jgi:hypothetical protein
VGFAEAQCGASVDEVDAINVNTASAPMLVFTLKNKVYNGDQTEGILPGSVCSWWEI